MSDRANCERHLGRTAIALALVCALASCSQALQSSPDAATGSGGTSGQAGTTGSGGQMGRTPPSCLSDLFADCPIDGACRWDTKDGGPAQPICFASGTRAVYTPGQICTNSIRSQADVAKPDGSPCFKLVIQDGSLCESQMYTWTDAAGNVVATAYDSLSGFTVRCATTDETVSCNSNSSTTCLEGVLVFGPLSCAGSSCP
jgi:hypothetical protein